MQERKLLFHATRYTIAVFRIVLRSVKLYLKSKQRVVVIDDWSIGPL